RASRTSRRRGRGTASAAGRTRGGRSWRRRTETAPAGASRPPSPRGPRPTTPPAPPRRQPPAPAPTRSSAATSRPADLPSGFSALGRGVPPPPARGRPPRPAHGGGAPRGRGGGEPKGEADRGAPPVARPPLAPPRGVALRPRRPRHVDVRPGHPVDELLE